MSIHIKDNAVYLSINPSRRNSELAQVFEEYLLDDMERRYSQELPARMVHVYCRRLPIPQTNTMITSAAGDKHACQENELLGLALESAAYYTIHV